MLDGESSSEAYGEFVYRYDVTVGDQHTTMLKTESQAKVSELNPTNKTEISIFEQMEFQHTKVYGELILQSPPQPEY